jgi:hypothetical protein
MVGWLVGGLVGWLVGSSKCDDDVRRADPNQSLLFIAVVKGVFGVCLL